LASFVYLGESIRQIQQILHGLLELVASGRAGSLQLEKKNTTEASWILSVCKRVACM